MDGGRLRGQNYNKIMGKLGQCKFTFKTNAVFSSTLTSINDWQVTAVGCCTSQVYTAKALLVNSS